MKNWKTSLLGALIGVTQVATAASKGGMHLGHFGGSDFLTVISAVGVTLLGLFAKDHNVTGS